MMNKLFTSLLVGCLFFTMNLAAQPTFTITPQNSTAEVNDVLTFDVAVSNFSNVLSMQFSINWNASILSYVEITSINSAELPGLNGNGIAAPGDGNIVDGEMALSWFDDTFSGLNLPDGTVLFSFSLRAIADGTSSVSFANTPAAIELIDANFVELTLNPQNASVTVGGGGNNNPTDLSLNISNSSGEVGETVCVNVSVQDFSNLISMQHSINYDPSILQFSSIGNFNLSDLTISQFGLPPSLTPGNITLSWLDNSLQGITIPNGTDIYEICFIAIAPGSSNISITNTPSNIEVIDVDLNNVNVNPGSGTVNITGETGGGGDLEIILSNETVDVGDQVCVEVSVNNFTDIVSMQLSIDYDPSDLQFMSVGGFNLVDLSAGQFGVPPQTNAGSITLSWLENALEGVTLPNGTTIFEICFMALSEGQTTIDITNSPAAIEIIDVDLNTVTPNTQSGTVTIDGDGGGSTFDGFTLLATEESTTVGDQVCVTVEGYNFEDIISMQLSINYDPAQLEFVSVTNFNLEDLSASNFGAPPSTTPGNISLSWLQSSLAGATVSDGTPLFDICFNALNQGCSDIVFSSSPTDIEVINVGAQEVQFNSQAGQVCAQAVDPGEDFTLDISNGSGDAGSEVCVNVTTANFDNIRNLTFSLNYDPNVLDFNNATDFNLTGLNAGDFSAPSPGVITFSWSNSSGVSVADGTSLFELCFDLIGSPSDESDITFTGIPVGISATNSSNQNVNVVGQEGTISINFDPNAFTLEIEDAQVESGDNFCLEITPLNFDNIISLQFSLAYDPNELSFSSIQNFNLTDLEIDNFGLPGDGAIDPGEITMFWFDNTTNGVSVADNVPIFEVCFQAIGDCGTNTNVQFTSTPTAIEVIELGDNILDLQAINSVVEICAVPAIVISTPANVTPIDCPGDTNGAIDINVSGGTNCYEYQWSYQNRTTQDLTGLPAGIYTVTVTDCDGTSSTTASFTVDSPEPITTNIVVSDVRCAGQSNGEIDLNVSGGTGTLNYNWTPSNLSGENPTGLGVSQFYRVTIIDENGCTEVSNFIEVDEPAALTISPSVYGDNCGESFTSTLALNVEGGTPNYFVNWAGSLSDGPTLQSGLAPGTYSATITDDNGCTLQSGGINAIPPPPVEIIEIIPSPGVNGGPGSIAVTVSGGSGNYTYAWSGPSGFPGSNDSALTGLGILGEYCVTVTDESNCPVTACALLSPVVNIANVSITRACPGEANGGIDISVNDGCFTEDYIYAWSGPNDFTSEEEDLVDIVAGSYFVVITDCSGTSINGSFEVTEFQETVVNVDAITNIFGDPSNANGEIRLENVGSYSYSWSNGAGGFNIFGLSTGEYCVNVTNSSQLGGGCTVDTCFFVFFPLTADQPVRDDVSCSGLQDGSISFELIGGIGPYTVQYGNQTINTGGGPISLDGLAPGEYEVIITDSIGNILTLDPEFSTIIDAAPITIPNNFNIIHDSETAGCSGAIEIFPEGGTGDYEVSWNAPTSGTSIFNLCEGCYEPVVTDGNGCEVTIPCIQVTTFAVNGVITNSACADIGTGEIDLLINGGSAPYTFMWSHGPTTEDVTNLEPGTYTVIISEASGNTLAKEFVVGVNSNLTSQINILTNFNGFAVSCQDSNDGRATIIGNGGSQNFSYEWMLNGSLISVDQTLQNAVPGIYTAIIIDNVEGCEIENTVELLSPSAMEINGIPIDPTCAGLSTGEITLQVSGGATNFPYSYSWSNAGVGPRITGLTSGNYSVTVRDANQCTATATFGLTEPAPLTVNVIAEPETEDCNGVASLTVTGGTGPYSFNWLTVGGNVAMQTDLCHGNYQVVVTDSNNCPTEPTEILVEVPDRRFPCTETRKVITPDGDGLNEEFIINCVEEFRNSNLRIYNRWGQIVFEMDNYDNSWAGRGANGERLPDGPYYFVLEYTGSDNNRIQMKGSLTLLTE